MMRYCARQFEAADIDHIRALIATEPQLSRYKLSIRICEELNWRRPDGKPKDMSCRVALLRMQEDGVLRLPPARWSKPVTYGVHPDIERAVIAPSIAPNVDLDRLGIELVVKETRGNFNSRLWNAYIQNHHYLGHQLMPGAQLRYLIRAEGQVVALLGFGASAWKVKPRDEYIGWNAEQRRTNLHLVVNNARFLILPWIHRPNLASKILALISRRIGDDWQARYSYRPVMLETFTEDARFRGTCYQAANWRCLGKTQGRGKLDTNHRYIQPIKSVWAYPLTPDFRRHLYV